MPRIAVRTEKFCPVAVGGTPTDARSREAALDLLQKEIERYIVEVSDAWMPHGSQREWVRRFMESYALRNGRLPRGKHRVRGLPHYFPQLI